MVVSCSFTFGEANYNSLPCRSKTNHERSTGLRLASSVFNCRYSSITLIDADRQWFKSAVNLELSESGREVAFCNHTISQDDALIIPDTKKDPRFEQNPFVIGEPYVRFYAGVSLVVDGQAVGALCVFDSEPRIFSYSP